MLQPFRTELSARPAPFSISHQSPALLLGSCFADVIGHKLEQARFPVLANPFGTLYNPLSINKLFDETYLFDSHGFVQQDDLWLHEGLHSEVWGLSRKALEAEITRRHQELQAFLPQTQALYLTWGTAWVYERIATRRIVGNCHKQPGHLFGKKLLSLPEIVSATQATLNRLWRLYPHLQVVLTLSPVRHLRDGFEENAVSKATLRLAIHQLLAQNAERLSYFPAWEWVMDDLRDYRFYAADRLHLSPDGEEYLWQQFQQTYFSAETQKLHAWWDKMRQSLEHRPQHPGSAQHLAFLEASLEALRQMEARLPLGEPLQKLQAEREYYKRTSQR